jgi:predicted acetyltransferase
MHDGVHVRELTTADLVAAWQLGKLAFGGTGEPPSWMLEPVPSMTRYGAFDASGRLVGKATDLHHEQWWAGRVVRAADVAGVAVLPEARGRGVARAMLSELLRGARARGAAVSALYPTVAAPYRSCGWETAGTMLTVDLATAALPQHRPSPRLTVRPGSPADVPAVTDLYQRIARSRCGLLTRTGGLFKELQEPDALLNEADGMTLVHDDDSLVGYATWERGEGYDSTAVLEVPDVLAATAEAARELVGVLASWRSVTPTLRLRVLAGDAVAPQLPLEHARVHQQQMWMHRPVDVERAVAARGWPLGARGEIDLTVEDPIAPWNAGSWRLEVADGGARLHRISGDTDLHLDIRGFAMLYAGAAHPDAVAEAGLLRCAGGRRPDELDLLGSGRPAQLLDYF